MLDRETLIENAVQASIDAGLAVNGQHGVASARHAARFMFDAIQAAQPAVTDDDRERIGKAVIEALYALRLEHVGRASDILTDAIFGEKP